MVSGFTRDLYAMPAELGSLVSLWQPATGGSSEKFVVHIQDAHSNPEGQAHVAAMLRYLESKAPELVIGLEGASGELHPEYLEFFKDYPEVDRAVVSALEAQGELNGVERFLLEKRWEGGGRRAEGVKVEAPSSILHPPSVLGIETPELYRDNLKTYRELLSRRGDMQKLLAPARVALEKEASKMLRAELRDFLKERSRRKEGKFDLEASLGAQSDADLAAYIRYLRSLALKRLEIDLNDPIEQLRFPNLMRIVRLEETRSGYEPAAVRSQWEAVIRELKAAAKTADEKAFVAALTAFAGEKKFVQDRGGRRADGEKTGMSPSSILHPISSAPSAALYPRTLLEGLFRFSQAHNISFSGQEAFWQSWKLLVFQAEVDVAELIEEIEKLEGLLLEKFAASDAEKTLVQKLGDLDLLEKMLRLELSRREYARALAGRERLQSFVAASRPLAGALEKAYGFYEVSLQRDETLVENLLKIQDGGWGGEDGEKQLAPSALRPPPSRIFILYSGGFHTPGIEEILRQKGIGYAVFSPRITGTDHGEMYQRAMDGDNADLSAYFKVKNPFLTNQEALLFKQLIETAAPALSKTYNLSPGEVAAQVSQAVKDHPVLSGVVLAEPGSGTESAFVRFQSKPDLQTLLPQNSSAIPEAILESVHVARANAVSLNVHESVAGVVDFASGAGSSVTAPRSEMRIPQVEFFHPSRKTSRLAYSFMRQALREEAIDPMTGKTVDLEAIAKDVNDLNRALLSLSGERLKGLFRNIIAETKPLMIPGKEKDHDLTELKWQMTEKAHELLVRHYWINHPGGFGKATDPILMLSEIIAEMYLKKRLGHELPAKYAAFQRPAPAEASVAAQKPLAKGRPSLEELAARIRAAASQSAAKESRRSEMRLASVKPSTSRDSLGARSKMREIPGVLTRQEGFLGELVEPDIRATDEYFFEFDARKVTDAHARFSHILQALKASLRVHLREELLPVSEALVDIFDPVNYSGTKKQRKDFEAKIAGLKAALKETLDDVSYQHIKYLIDEQLELQGKLNGDRNPVGPFVKFYKSVIRAMLPSGVPEDAQKQDLYTGADITLRQFRVLIYSQFRCSTDPEKQLDMLEAALKKQIAQADSIAQSDDMSIAPQGLMLAATLRTVQRRFLGENREEIKKLLTPELSIITILYSKILASDAVPLEEIQRFERTAKEKTGKSLNRKSKEHLMYGRGLYQRQRFIEKQIRLEGVEMCKRKYPQYYFIPDLVNSLESVIAEVAQQGTVDYDPGKSRRVVVKIDQTIGVGQFREIMKMYPGMVGVITDSITANSHPSAISPVPILIVDPSNRDFREIKKGDMVAVEPAPDGQTTAKVNANPEESARIESENEKRALLEKAFRTLVPIDSRIKHLANAVVGEDLASFLDILEGIGLTRTEVDEAVENEIVEMIRSYNKMSSDARSYQKLSRKLLDIMVERYYSQVHNPKLQGRTNKFRTIDVQRDKNENLFVYYNGGTGIEFYETDLGREVLTTQLAAFLMILGNEVLEQKGLASYIQVMFPQVRNPADAVFLRDQILPEAINRAQLELKRSRGRLRSLGDADGTLNGKVHPPLSDETVAAAVEKALDAVSFEIMGETLSLFDAAPNGENGRLAIDEILKLQYRGKAFIRGVSVGMNDLEFSIVREIIEKRRAGKAIAGLTAGESVVLDEIVTTLQGRNLDDLTRDEAALQPLFGKLTPVFVRYYETIARAAAKAGIPLSFCGETAGKDEFVLFAEYLIRTHNISLSKSMGPRKVARLRIQTHKIERDLDKRTEMPEWFQKFSQGEDASAAMSRYLSQAFVEDPALQSFLLDLAKVQEEFVTEGYFDGLFRPDFNPLNQAGGFGIFRVLKSQLARQKPLIELSEGTEVPFRELMVILEYMKDRALISEGQAKTITEAYWLFQVIAEVFEKLKKQGSSLVYEDGLNPETTGAFYQKVAEDYSQRVRQPLPWGDGAPEETVASYSSMLFGLVTDALRDEYLERIPPTQQTQVIEDLEQASGVGTTGQEEPLEMVMDERSDITLYLETLVGFRHSREKYMRIRQKAHPDQDFVETIVYHFRYVPEDMIRILLVAAEKGARIDLRVQRAMSIIAHEKSRNSDPAWTQRLNEKGWPLLHRMLLLPQNVHYSEIQLTRFNLLQLLLPKEDMPSSSKILSVGRSMTLLEILSKEDPFQVRAYHVLRTLGAEQRHLLTLRLALYPNLLKSIPKVDPDGNAERYRVMQLHNTVSALLRQDLLSPVKIEEAVEGILSGVEAAQLSPEERSVFFSQVYLMALVQRMAAFDPVDRKLLLQEGINSPFAAIEQVYLALIESLARPDSFSIPAAVRHAAEMVADAKAWQPRAEGYQEIPIYPRPLFDDFRQGIATGGVWRSVLEDYLAHTQEGELPGLRKYLEEVIKDNTRLSEYLGYFTQESSEYYLRGLGPKELLRQLFHYIHLDYLRNMDLDDGNAEVVATVRPVFFRKITSSVHHTYEIGFGDVIDHPGILGLYLKVLGRNGFQIAGVEPSLVEFPEAKLMPGEKKKTVAKKQNRGLVVRVLGYFPHSVNPEDRIQTIQQDLNRLIKLPRKTGGSIAAQVKATTENAWRLALDKGKGYGPTVSTKIPGRQAGSEPDSVSFVRSADQGLQLLIETRQERTNFYEALIGMIHIRFPKLSVESIHRNLRGNAHRVVIALEGEVPSRDQRKLLELVGHYLQSEKTSIGKDVKFVSRSESRAQEVLEQSVKPVVTRFSVAGFLRVVTESVRSSFLKAPVVGGTAENWSALGALVLFSQDEGKLLGVSMMSFAIFAYFHWLSPLLDRISDSWVAAIKGSDTSTRSRSFSMSAEEVETRAPLKVEASRRSESRVDGTEVLLERKFQVHGVYGINEEAAARLVDAVAYFRQSGMIDSATLSYGMATIPLDDAVKLAGLDVLPGAVVIRVQPSGEGSEIRDNLRKFWSAIESVQFNNGNTSEWHQLLTLFDPPVAPVVTETVRDLREYVVNAKYGIHIRPSQKIEALLKKYKPVVVSMFLRNLTEDPARGYQVDSHADVLGAILSPDNRVEVIVNFKKNAPHLEREKTRFWAEWEGLRDETSENERLFETARSESRAFWTALLEKLPFRKKSDLKPDVQKSVESVDSVVSSLPDRNELVPILDRESFGPKLPAEGLLAGPIVRAPSGNFAQARTAVDRDRMVHLLNHVLNGKLVVLRGASDERLNKIESLRDTVRETLAFFRIFTPEIFRARGGIFFIPRGNEDVFAYRISSQRSSTKIYVTPVFGSMPVEHALDAWEWDRLTREPWFREMRDLFMEDVAVLEALKKELFAPKPSPELRGRIVLAAESIHRHLKTVSGDNDSVIPIEAQRPEKTVTSLDAEAVPRPVRKILAVDDDPRLLKLLVAQLRSLERASGERYTVEWAVDGADALAKLRSDSFDLVVTDLAMPRMGGEELAREILEDGRGEFVLFVSGWGGAGIDLQALRAKGLRVDFLQKPYSLQALKDAVESFSSRSEIRNERVTGPEVARWSDPVARFQGGTRELVESVSKAMGRSEMRKIVEKWTDELEKKGSSGAAAVLTAAKQLGLYSQKSLTFEMKDPRKARLWIALKVLEEMEASEGRVENQDLRDVITKVLASAKEMSAVANLGKAGPEFHVNMSRMNEAGVFENPSEKDWDELARNFPVVIALLISLHGSLSINVNVPEAELKPVREKFAAMLKKEGIRMDPKRFRFVSASAKVPFESFKSGKASLLGRDLEVVKIYNKNVTRWFSNDRGNMAAFAAGLATALLRSAGDENLDRRKVHEPSEFDRVLATVVNAIAGYASIRKSA